MPTRGRGMTPDCLARQRILVVEDDYFIAKHLCEQLRGCDAIPVGPLCSVADALARTSAGGFDAALLDVNLNGECVYGVADALRARGIPFAFTSGYGRNLLPERFRDTPLAVKPCGAQELIDVMCECLQRN
jgi:CheY-like chemotaxis protein